MSLSKYFSVNYNNPTFSQWDINFYNYFKNVSLLQLTPCRAKWEDGTQASTAKVVGMHIVYDSFPISILRKQAFKMPIQEILATWQNRSTKISDLGKVWNQWDVGDGTIGKGYGYQLAKLNNNNLNQVDNLLHLLTTDRYSRRMVASMWDHCESHEMGLTPCAYQIQLVVEPTLAGDCLHLVLHQRSSDVILAGSWNIQQYWVLLEMFARHAGFSRDLLVLHHVVGDSHIYDKHMSIANEMIGLYKEFYKADTIIAPNKMSPPELLIDDEVKGFYDFTVDSFKLKGYYPMLEFKGIEVAT